MTTTFDRRRSQRFLTPPMYHAISLRLLEHDDFRYDGHAYDISEGGVQFEIDRPVEPGTEVALRIALPAGFDTGPGRAVFVTGRVIWIGDIDEPGPVRMAVAFTRFARSGDQQRLRRLFDHRRLRLAA